MHIRSNPCLSISLSAATIANFTNKIYRFGISFQLKKKRNWFFIAAVDLTFILADMAEQMKLPKRRINSFITPEQLFEHTSKRNEIIQCKP